MSDKDININVNVLTEANVKPVEEATEKVKDLAEAQKELESNSGGAVSGLRGADKMLRQIRSSAGLAGGQLRSLGGALGRLGALLTPQGLFIAGIGLAAKALFDLREKMKEIEREKHEEVLRKQAEALSEITRSAESARDKIHEMNEKTRDAIKLADELRNANRAVEDAQLEAEKQTALAKLPEDDTEGRRLVEAQFAQRAANMRGKRERDDIARVISEYENDLKSFEDEVAVEREALAKLAARKAELEAELKLSVDQIRIHGKTLAGTFGLSGDQKTWQGIYRNRRDQIQATDTDLDATRAKLEGAEARRDAFAQRREVLDTRKEAVGLAAKNRENAATASVASAQSAVQKRDEEERRKQEEIAQARVKAAELEKTLAAKEKENEDMRARLAEAQRNADNAAKQASTSQGAFEASKGGGYTRRQQDALGRRAAQEAAAAESARDSLIDMQSELGPALNAGTEAARGMSRDLANYRRAQERLASDIPAGR